MNLVGKIFIVVILVMSLVFMALTISVFTAQKNWRDVAMLSKDDAAKTGKDLGLHWALENAKHDLADLNDRKDKQEKEYKAEKATREQSLTTLTTKLESLKKENKSLEAGKADLEKDKRDLVAAANNSQKNATNFQQERDKLRTEKIEAQRDRDAYFKKVVETTDLYNQSTNDNAQLRKRLADVTNDLVKADDEIRYFDLPNKNSDYKSKTPPKVDAIVTSVNGDGLIVISLGSDAGLRVGHKLEVYRVNGGQSTYVGRVEVVKTDPSNAVCKVDPKFQTSNVMVNDRVASKIE
jgi:vacuolar-type H+-ATPase subunit I/STV1